MILNLAGFESFSGDVFQAGDDRKSQTGNNLKNHFHFSLLKVRHHGFGPHGGLEKGDITENYVGYGAGADHRERPVRWLIRTEGTGMSGCWKSTLSAREGSSPGS